MTTVLPGEITVAFVTGLAQHLADQAPTVFSYDTDTPGTVAIFWPTAPFDVDAVLVLAPYALTDDPTQPEATIGLQIRARTAADDYPGCLRLLDAATAAMLGLYPFTLTTGVRLTAQVSTSAVAPVLDDSNRWTGIRNIVWRVHRPTPHRY